MAVVGQQSVVWLEWPRKRRAWRVGFDFPFEMKESFVLAHVWRTPPIRRSYHELTRSALGFTFVPNGPTMDEVMRIDRKWRMIGKLVNQGRRIK